MTRPLLCCVAQRHWRQAEPVVQLGEYAGCIRAGAVDLVDEQQGGYTDALQRPHQQRRLRLHSLNRGHDEDRRVEHR